MYICIDIGGTEIKYGLATADGVLTTHDTMATMAQREGAQGIMHRVDGIIERYQIAQPIDGVAISTAGVVDTGKGEILYALPEVLPGYTGVNWKDHIGRIFQLPCAVENDVNCAALGELWHGAGKGMSSLVCMTIGTSIGGAIIIDKKILHGVSHSAGEIAFMEIHGEKLYKVATTTRLITDVAEAIGQPRETLDGKKVFALAAAGNDAVRSCLDAFAANLAASLINIMALLNPPLIVLGGGIMAQEAILRPLIEQQIATQGNDTICKSTRIAFASLGNTAGMIGALYHFLQEMNIH